MKKTVSLLLVVLLLASCFAPVCASAASRVDSIDSIIIDMYNDASSSPQQTSAAALGSMYMLKIIVDSSCGWSRSESVSDLVSRITDQLGSLDGAPQVSALCLYGCVLELCAIAYEKDRYGAFNDLISSVSDSLFDSDTSSAVQEMALASYRMVDVLSIIAAEEGCSTDMISSINDTLSRNNAGLSGAPQQTANGLYRSAELLYLISQKAFSYSAANRVSGLLDNMYEDNNRCESAVQQTTNGMVTIYLMLRAIAYDLE